MGRCIALACNGLGFTYPNPLVGCVIVHDGKIIGEGWHHRAGGPHAEVEAIRRVKNILLLKESTLFVNLEPCCHFGKTPPCVDLIIKHKIPRVVIGVQDPNELVAGEGIKKLEASGCEVVLSMLNGESNFLNRRFIAFHQKKRPYIILKWAATKDEWLAPLQRQKESSEIYWITQLLSQQLVHKWRSQEEAILVGVQTICDDDPSLTTRHWSGDHPKRFIIDPNGRIPKNASLLNDADTSFVLTKRKNIDVFLKKQILPCDFTDVSKVVTILFEQNIQSVIVEGGRKTLQQFIDTDLWDEARVFTGSCLLGGGVKAPTLNKQPHFSEKMGKDELHFYFNSSAFEYA